MTITRIRLFVVVLGALCLAHPQGTVLALLPTFRSRPVIKVASPTRMISSNVVSRQRSVSTWQHQSTKSDNSAEQSSNKKTNAWRQALAMIFSQRAAAHTFGTTPSPSERRAMQIYTLLRVTIPSVLAGVASTLLFPALSMGLATMMNDAGVFTVLSTDSSQFVQNFLTVAGLLFSILVGQTYCMLKLLLLNERHR